MIAFFFNKTGYVVTVALENYCAVNSYCYTTIRLPEVIDELRKNNPKRRIILHHDNASSHTAKQTNNFLDEKNVELMSNPAYSSSTLRTSYANLINSSLRPAYNYDEHSVRLQEPLPNKQRKKLRRNKNYKYLLE
ncbi:hypothetical protein EVAR_13603_1 [Eumeta japonica]|uniref:Mariner Mos1 transposase n=1 Tax=Eumeta variegata TaxID=151549 RepID=A0A4C1UTY3_EUMVA|nr:hypothetical protein EVAR_13603_1 [Eumeta japonica]